MSMYNMIFGTSPVGPVLLAMLKLTPGDVGRYRDAGVYEGKIAVYTRNGGGNRACWSDYVDREADGNCRCTGCFMAENVQKHPNYLYDQDDEFDSTYATIYYSFPEKWKELLEQLDSGEPFEPDKRWLGALEALKG